MGNRDFNDITSEFKAVIASELSELGEIDGHAIDVMVDLYSLAAQNHALNEVYNNLLLHISMGTEFNEEEVIHCFNDYLAMLRDNTFKKHGLNIPQELEE